MAAALAVPAGPGGRRGPVGDSSGGSGGEYSGSGHQPPARIESALCGGAPLCGFPDAHGAFLGAERTPGHFSGAAAGLLFCRRRAVPGVYPAAAPVPAGKRHRPGDGGTGKAPGIPAPAQTAVPEKQAGLWIFRSCPGSCRGCRLRGL